MNRFAGEGLIKLGMWYPYINPKGFPAGDWRRAGVTADNTWDAIKRGERTATTRLPVWYGRSPGVLEQIKGIKPGQEIMFTRGNDQMIVEAKPSPFSVNQANLYQKNSFIDSLEPNQVFVFGSNTEGRHGKGAALAARQKFGAKYGQAEGLQGQSYGLITKDLRTGRMPLEFIDNQVNKLYQQAQARPDLEFLVSPVGTNLAGWTPREMGPLFTQKNVPSNVSLPGAFLYPEYQGLGGSTYALTRADMLSGDARSAKLRDRWSQIEGWNEDFIPLLWNQEPSGVAYQFQYKPVNPTNRINIDMAPSGQVIAPPPPPVPQPTIIQQLASPASPIVTPSTGVPTYQTIAGTGHRPDKLSEGGYKTYWNRDLPRLTDLASMTIRRHQPSRVISGMAQGWDTALADAALREGVPLTAAVPAPWFPTKWPVAAQRHYNNILEKADRVVFVNQERPILDRFGNPIEGYNPRALNIRNQWMSDNTDAFVALHNGTKGGTWNNIQDAEQKGIPVHNYWPSWIKHRGF